MDMSFLSVCHTFPPATQEPVFPSYTKIIFWLVYHIVAIASSLLSVSCHTHQMWRKECLWKFCVLYGVHLSILGVYCPFILLCIFITQFDWIVRKTAMLINVCAHHWDNKYLAPWKLVKWNLIYIMTLLLYLCMLHYLKNNAASQHTVVFAKGLFLLNMTVVLKAVSPVSKGCEVQIQEFNTGPVWLPHQVGGGRHFWVCEQILKYLTCSTFWLLQK